MAFGQPSGPAATARQLRDLTALIEGAGHVDFKDARGPLGLNQRQAGGRFTQDEASELIARLQADAEAEEQKQQQKEQEQSDGTDGPEEAPALGAPPRAASRTQSLARQLQRVPEELLVDELRRRGWSVAPPTPNN
ncbi:MAG: hypothetical protein WCI26_04845 [Acidimicrobiales bacterium]